VAGIGGDGGDAAVTMLALTLVPGHRGSVLTKVAEPDPSAGAVLCRTIAVGDGTDAEIVDGLYGEPPLGQDRLTLDALARADRAWLERLATRWVPLASWPEALEHRPDDVKVVVEVSPS